MADYHRNNNLAFEMHVSDFEPVKQFYGTLGFEVMHEELPTGHHGGFMILQRENTRLQFYGGNEYAREHHYFRTFGDAKIGNGVEVIIPVEDVEKLYEIASKQLPDAVVVEMKERSWGDKDFRIKDPNGFYLRFTS